MTEYTPTSGENITDTAAQVARLCKALGEPIEFTFNGTKVQIESFERAIAQVWFWKREFEQEKEGRR